MTPNFLGKGDSVSLRKDVLPHVKVREWIFIGKTEGRVILVSYKPNGGHTLEVVKEEEIDWEEYCSNWKNRFSQHLMPAYPL